MSDWPNTCPARDDGGPTEHCYHDVPDDVTICVCCWCGDTFVADRDDSEGHGPHVPEGHRQNWKVPPMAKRFWRIAAEMHSVRKVYAAVECDSTGKYTGILNGGDAIAWAYSRREAEHDGGVSGLPEWKPTTATIAEKLPAQRVEEK